MYKIPSYVSSPNPNVNDTAKVDVVFNDYILPKVLPVLNKLQPSMKYDNDSAVQYTSVTTDNVLPNFAEKNWN